MRSLCVSERVTYAIKVQLDPESNNSDALSPETDVCLVNAAEAGDLDKWQEQMQKPVSCILVCTSSDGPFQEDCRSYAEIHGAQVIFAGDDESVRGAFEALLC